MKHIQPVLVLAIAALGQVTSAAANTQVPLNRTITSIGSYATSGYIVFSPAVPNLEGCPYTAGDTVYFDWSTEPDAKAMYATALAAYVAGHKVGFGVNGCMPGSAPRVYRLDVAR